MIFQNAHFNHPGYNSPEFYLPGQTIGGNVIVITGWGRRINGICLKLSGHVTFQWGDSTEAKTFFKNKKFLCDENGNAAVRLEEGENTFHFLFTLPINLPSSYYSGYPFAQVFYTVAATIQNKSNSFHKDKSCKLPFKVCGVVPLPLEHTPFLFIKRRSARFPFKGGGDILVQFSMERTAFFPGELVCFSAEILNQSSTLEVNLLKIKFCQSVTLFAGKNEMNNQNYLEWLTRVVKLYKMGDSFVWNGSFQIPIFGKDGEKLPPTGGCKIIRVKYLLRFKAFVCGFARNVKFNVLLTICSIPHNSVTLPPLPEVTEGLAETLVPSAIVPCSHPSMSTPPPTYDEAVGSNSTWDSPPAYSDVISLRTP